VGPLSTSSMCFLFVADATALHDQWRNRVPRDSTKMAAGSSRQAVTDHGMSGFAMVDPSGNLLRIGTSAE
jgi:hypothetical protein